MGKGYSMSDVEVGLSIVAVILIVGFSVLGSMLWNVLRELNHLRERNIPMGSRHGTIGGGRNEYRFSRNNRLRTT